MIFQEFYHYNIIELNVYSDIYFDFNSLFSDKKRFFLINDETIDHQAYNIRGLSHIHNLIKDNLNKTIVLDFQLSKIDKSTLLHSLHKYVASSIIILNRGYLKMNGFSSKYSSDITHLSSLSLSININKDKIKIIENKDRLDIYLPSSIQRDEKNIENIYLKTKRARKLYQILNF